MNTARKLVFRACLAAAVILLAAGYAQARLWPGEIFILLILISAWLGDRQGWAWLPSALLVSCVSAAAGGVLLGAPPLWMIAAASAALAVFELSEPRDAASVESAHPLTRALDRQRVTLLGATIGLGLTAALVGLYVQISIPFVGIVLIVLMVLLALYRFSGLLRD